MTIVTGNIRLMRIFAVVLKIYVNFPDVMPTSLHNPTGRQGKVIQRGIEIKLLCLLSNENKKAQLSLTNPRDACEKFARFM